MAEEPLELHLLWLARNFGRPDYLPLAPDDLDALAEVAEVVEHERNGHLYRQGDPAQAAYVLRRGSVEISRETRGSRLLIARVGSGSTLGDIELFLNGPYLASAVAVEATSALRIDEGALLRLLAEHPRIALRWLGVALRQLADRQRRIAQLLRKSLKVQLADLILDLAGEEDTVTLPQQTLGELLGVSRQAVGRALRDLRELGLVETGHRWVRIADREGLSLLAES